MIGLFHDSAGIAIVLPAITVEVIIALGFALHAVGFASA